MACTGILFRKLRQFAVSNEINILLDGALSATVNLDPLGLQLHQGAHADASYDHGINLQSSQSLDGLTHAMGMMQIAIVDFFHVHLFRIHNDKAGRRPEMSINSAIQSLQCFSWKTNLHTIISFLFFINTKFDFISSSPPLTNGGWGDFFYHVKSPCLPLCKIEVTSLSPPLQKGAGGIYSAMASILLKTSSISCHAGMLHQVFFVLAALQLCI